MFNGHKLGHDSYLLVDVDECSSNPCENGGSCEDGDNSYTCNCVLGYTDSHCETGNYVKELPPVCHCCKFQKRLIHTDFN